MAGDQNVPFAGLLHPENPSSGVYGGMSLIWFPIAADDAGSAGSLLTFVCGTRGLSPDESIMGRPGHARHLRALGRYLHCDVGTPVWTKRDPTNLSQDVPDVVKARFPRFSALFSRYGQYLYAVAEVPEDLKKARRVVGAFLDFYAWERNWLALKGSADEVAQLKCGIRSHVFPKVSQEDWCSYSGSDGSSFCRGRRVRARPSWPIQYSSRNSMGMGRLFSSILP